MTEEWAAPAIRAGASDRNGRGLTSNRLLMTTDHDYNHDYRRGWATSQRVSQQASEGALERADARGESSAWYDGYMDHASGRRKWFGPDGKRNESGQFAS